MVEFLLNNGADAGYRDFESLETCLHITAASMRGEAAVQMFKILLSRGVDVNWRDASLRMPLHVAIDANSGSSDASAEVESFLIERGADVYALDVRKRLPLHYVFVKRGKHLNNSKIDPIELCTTLTSVMETNGIDEADEFGQTPLHRAAIRGASVCCMHLISKGAAIDARDGEGNTALALAAKNRHER